MRLPARLTLVAIGVALVVAVVAPHFLSRASRGRDAPAAAGATTKPRVAVLVHTVRPGPLVERLATTGTLRANEQIEVTSEIAGQVREVRFREGSEVDAGAVLVTLDDSELRARRDGALHRVELAEGREARQRKLLADQLVSQQEYDLVRTELDVLRAELALAEAQLAKTVVRAPFEGMVGLRNVSPGAYITSQTRIASLQDLDPMKVDFTVPERYAARLAIGRPVELSVAGVDSKFKASIIAVEPVVNPDTRSIVVRAQLANPGRRLRPGAFADVSIVVTNVPEALSVPSVGIIPELGGHRVMVVENGVADSRAVEIGIRTDTAVEVTSGLKAGDQVIVGGLERVGPGDPVEAREAN
jgi:membrane fusion protein, multidrug efflux system